MHVNPMGIPMRETTTESVALKASVRIPTWAFLGSTLLVHSRSSSAVDEPMRKRAKVPTEHMRKFRRLCELPLSVDNIVRVGRWVLGRYLGKLVLGPSLAS